MFLLSVINLIIGYHFLHMIYSYVVKGAHDVWMPELGQLSHCLADLHHSAVTVNSFHLQ